MSTLKTQYREFLKSNPKCKYSYDEWMDKYWEPSKKINEIDQINDEYINELRDWDVTLLDGLDD